MPLPPGVAETLIHQTEHPLHGKAASFRAHDSRLDSRLATAFGNGFRKQHDRPNHFVIVLNVVNKSQLVLRKILRSRHAIPPSRDRNRRTTAEAHMVAALPWQAAGAPADSAACGRAVHSGQNREAKRCDGNYYILQK